MNQPIGTDDNEWFELHNYGLAPVNLTGWTISDEDGDSDPLPSISLASGETIVITNGKMQF